VEIPGTAYRAIQRAREYLCGTLKTTPAGIEAWLEELAHKVGVKRTWAISAKATAA
jgi:hypothetical protein